MNATASGIGLLVDGMAGRRQEIPPSFKLG